MSTLGTVSCPKGIECSTFQPKKVETCVVTTKLLIADEIRGPQVQLNVTGPKTGALGEQCVDFLPNPLIPTPPGADTSTTYAYWLFNSINASPPPNSDFILPNRGIAIVTCMDARVNSYAQLGVQTGEAHIIRNAGGVVNDDVLRSLAISQELLFTTEIMLVHHKDCGMTKFRDEEFSCAYQTTIGIRPEFKFDDFNLRPSEVNVLENFVRIMLCPFLRHKERVSAWVWDDCDGQIYRVDTSANLACLQALVQADPPFAGSGDVQ